MAETLNSGLENFVMNKPLVSGVVCADSNGLLIAAKGDMDPKLSACIVTISKLATDVSNPNCQSSPVVVIDTHRGHTVLIKDYESAVIALKYKRGDE